MLTPLVALEDRAVVRNLVVAFEEELKANAAYRAYAVQADAEGLPGIASLFRATARSEQIHANNHARVIRHMSGEAIADLPEVQVQITRANLETALGDQRFETDYLYPTFLNEAISRLDTTAIRTFRWALEADKTHARLCRDAIAQLDSSSKASWTNAKHDFYVCTLCGYTAETPEAENCPACNFLWERFEVIQ